MEDFLSYSKAMTLNEEESKNLKVILDHSKIEGNDNKWTTKMSVDFSGYLRQQM